MMKKFLSIVLSCSLSMVAVYGQRLTNYERRHMNDKLLELVINYENYASFAEQYMQYSFMDLFQSADAKVFNDYIASSGFGQQIPVSEYAAYSTESAHVKFVEVRNLKKGEYSLQNGQYRVTVEFDKCLEYEDEINTYFSTEDEMIGGDFHVVMDCVYDKEEDKFFISSLQGTAHENNRFPTGKFVVIERKNDRDELLRVNGRPIKFNVFNEAYAEGAAAPVFADEDIVTETTVIASTDRYSKVNYAYRETRLRLKASATMAPMSAYQVSSPISFSEVRSGAYEGSVDFGYALPVGSTAKLAIYAGLGLSYSSLAMQVSGIDYSHELTNPAGVTYTRRYQLSTVNEGLSFLDIMIPVYASYEISAGPRMAISLDAGIKLYLNASTTVDPYRVEGTATNLYKGGEQTNTPLPNQITQYLVPATYMRNTYDLAAFGKLGLEFKVQDRRYIFVKVGYLQGLTESYNSNLSEWYNASEGIYPFVYSEKSGSDVAVRSFADCISYKRSALTFDLGFRMKF